jgi:hypothetical protein
MVNNIYIYLIVTLGQIAPREDLDRRHGRDFNGTPSSHAIVRLNPSALRHIGALSQHNRLS